MIPKKTYSVEYQKDEENQILIRTFYGVVDMKGVIYSWEEDIKDKRVTKDLNGIITNFVNAENLASFRDLKIITEFYDENFKLFENIRLAVVLDKPNVAVLLYYENQNTRLMHKAFTTFKAALNWCMV